MPSDVGKAKSAGESRKTPPAEKSLEAKLQSSSKINMHNADERLSKLYKRESDIEGEVKVNLGTLKGLMARVKTDGVKDCVKKLATLIDALLRSREEIRSESRVT